MSEDSSFSVPPMIRQGQLVEEISALVPVEVTGEWDRLKLVRRAVSMYAQEQLFVYRPDGSVATASTPIATGKLFRELREVMYCPGTGTWLSATWTLTRDAAGAVSVDVAFNYDDEPDWTRPINPGLYGLDLEDFPRDEEHIPGWLHERLDEARAAAKKQQQKKQG